MAKNQAVQQIKILGLMTGSSADGLDLCLVGFTGQDHSPDFEVLYSQEIPYPASFQKSFRNPLLLSDDQIAILDKELGLWFAAEIDKVNLEFDFIASHGQTIKHEPPFFSLQIGKPQAMADKFNCPVIYDFRTADIGQGGQGAPLIPIVEQYLIQEEYSDVLSLNIGGIANISIVPGSNNPAPLLAWDTGPGNTLIDKAVGLFTNGKLAYDKDGQLASQGKVNRKLLDELLRHEFYQRPPPRSAGQEQFGDSYFQNILKQFYPESKQSFKDFIYTLTLLTAKTIAVSIESLSSMYSPVSMLVSGGGAFNKTLMDLLRNEVPGIAMSNFDVGGVIAGNKEAFGFAYLGYLFTNGLTGNLPSVTGARKAVTLGKLCEPQTS
ncbi:MAG: anhydro-N-acetylmuramic acid kinase [Candidatus Marinimicrobia bacterium]|nr:anhydro-N-acetylmuramic acid kinase [Candidatus Neomarinimicrobiota bacterium]